MMCDKFTVDRRMVAGFIGAAATLVFMAGSVSTAVGASSTMSTTTTRTTVTRVRTARISAADRAFVAAAAQGGAMEVALGKFAQSNGGSASVRSFGRQMEIDHKKINHDLANTASAVGIPIEWYPAASDRAKLARIAKLHGAAFDKAYSADMVRDHEMDLAAFQRQASRGQNARIRAFAVRIVPIIRDHLQMAQAMQAGRPYAHRMTTMKSTTTIHRMNTTPMKSPSTPSNSSSPSTTSPKM